MSDLLLLAMLNHLLARAAVEAFKKYPFLPAAICFAVAAASGTGLWNTWSAYSSFKDKPETMSLASAADVKRPWITLSGAEWQCGGALDTKDDRLFPLTDAETGGLVAYQPAQGSAGCSDHAVRPASGVLEPMNDRYRAYLTGKGWKALDGVSPGKVWTLCGGCGPADTFLGVKIFGVLAAVFSALFLVFLGKLRTKSAAPAGES